ncbi:hypothetical protein HHI36_003484 [Cryptolaemus montrouzieri]|uniref:Uncharacterized protein n=1 Tax=Cryptolaemus montrouzieri TaxID=559131 RepID=A0ABD2PEH4_9CUCU
MFRCNQKMKNFNIAIYVRCHNAQLTFIQFMIITKSSGTTTNLSSLLILERIILGKKSTTLSHPSMNLKLGDVEDGALILTLKMTNFRSYESDQISVGTQYIQGVYINLIQF